MSIVYHTIGIMLYHTDLLNHRVSAPLKATRTTFRWYARSCPSQRLRASFDSTLWNASEAILALAKCVSASLAIVCI